MPEEQLKSGSQPLVRGHRATPVGIATSNRLHENESVRGWEPPDSEVTHERPMPKREGRADGCLPVGECGAVVTRVGQHQHHSFEPGSLLFEEDRTDLCLSVEEPRDGLDAHPVRSSHQNRIDCTAIQRVRGDGHLSPPGPDLPNRGSEAPEESELGRVPERRTRGKRSDRHVQPDHCAHSRQLRAADILELASLDVADKLSRASERGRHRRLRKTRIAARVPEVREHLRHLLARAPRCLLDGVAADRHQARMASSTYAILIGALLPSQLAL